MIWCVDQLQPRLVVDLFPVTVVERYVVVVVVDCVTLDVTVAVGFPIALR